MTTTTAFYRDPAFQDFLPYIKATAAWDKRHGNSPRFDLKSATPGAIRSRALAFTGHCVDCGRPIFPFRERNGRAKRGNSKAAVYMAATCSIPCRNGGRAREAYQVIWALLRNEPPPSDQTRLL